MLLIQLLINYMFNQKSIFSHAAGKSEIKFQSQLNILGASQQNRATEFSQTTEADGESKSTEAQRSQDWFQKDVITNF